MSSDRPPARSFHDLRVWQKAHEFVLAVYRYSESFPEREKFGLAHQLRRAAVSVPANIAEGFGKRSLAEKARFLNIAEGSVEECRYYPVLFGPVPRLGLWPERVADEHPGRNQQAAQRLCANDPGFRLLNSGSISRRDIKGEALA
jgi:hypothetical protein